MPKYSMQQIAEMTHAYLQRAQNEGDDVVTYPFDEVATFEILGGVVGEGGPRRSIPPIMHGRFLDVVAYAVQLPSFQNDGAINQNSGYVVKWTQPEANAPPARPKGLERLLKRLAAGKNPK